MEAQENAYTLSDASRHQTLTRGGQEPPQAASLHLRAALDDPDSVMLHLFSMASDAIPAEAAMELSAAAAARVLAPGSTYHRLEEEARRAFLKATARQLRCEWARRPLSRCDAAHPLEQDVGNPPPPDDERQGRVARAFSEALGRAMMHMVGPVRGVFEAVQNSVAARGEVNVSSIALRLGMGREEVRACLDEIQFMFEWFLPPDVVEEILEVLPPSRRPSRIC